MTIMCYRPAPFKSELFFVNVFFLIFIFKILGWTLSILTYHFSIFVGYFGEFLVFIEVLEIPDS